jgi:hypothetical protein
VLSYAPGMAETAQVPPHGDQVTDHAGRRWVQDANGRQWMQPCEGDPWYAASPETLADETCAGCGMGDLPLDHLTRKCRYCAEMAAFRAAGISAWH